MDEIRGNYLVSIIYKGNNLNDKVTEYNRIKNLISKLLYEEGYQYVIGDETIINEKLNK